MDSLNGEINNSKKKRSENYTIWTQTTRPHLFTILNFQYKPLNTKMFTDAQK